MRDQMEAGDAIRSPTEAGESPLRECEVRTVKRVPVGNLDSAGLSRDRLTSLLSDSYQVPGGILEAELARCDTCYCLFDDAGELESFFLTSRIDLPHKTARIPTLYLGLSASRKSSKNSGSVRLLYSAMLADARRWQEAHDAKLTLWYTTATPSACFAAYHLFAYAEPGSDGSYTSAGAEIMQSIRSYIRAGPSNHPFVLKSLYPGVAYTSDERKRIAEICSKKNFKLFEELNVNEIAGDRLAFVCRVPEAQESL